MVQNPECYWILAGKSEPAVGEALEVLQKEHGIKREDIWLQTKYVSHHSISEIIHIHRGPTDSQASLAKTAQNHSRTTPTTQSQFKFIPPFPLLSKTSAQPT